MKPPYDDLPAMRELRERLREAARREITSAAGQTARRRPTRKRRGVLVLVGVGSAAAAAAGAATLLSVGEPAKDTRGKSQQFAPNSGDRQVDVTARDPDLPITWGVAVYTAANGDACALPGQVRGGQIGIIRDRVFHPYERSTSGPCGDLGHQRLFYDVHRFPSDHRTVVYGRARAGVRTVAFGVKGDSYSATTGHAGAFLLLFEGNVAFSDVRPKSD